MLPEADLLAALPRLRRYARVLTGDLHRADDLVQDTLARAWQKQHLWQAGSNLRAWLFTLMHNIHANQWMQRHRDAMHISIDDESVPSDWQIPVRAMQFERVELIELFQRVAALPLEQRTVLMLAAVEELQYAEIAQVLAIPIGTVMSRLNRAREKLRRLSDDGALSLRIIK